jgi:hypothetical protein
MRKRKPPKAWTAYKLAKIGKRLGTVYGETEKEALANAQKEFAKTEARRSASICAASSWAKRVRNPRGGGNRPHSTPKRDRSGLMMHI